MSLRPTSPDFHSSRRQFIKRSSLAAASMAAIQLPFVSKSKAAVGRDMELNIGLVGCGGRGSGALGNALAAAKKVMPGAAKENIKVVGLADLFESKIEKCQKRIAKQGFNAPKSNCFSGFDAYKHLLAVPKLNYIILATPPHFRPAQLMAAVKAGKNAFIEKPVAVDAPGVRKIIEAGKLAKEKGLGIAAGTHRRHMTDYREAVKRIHDGAIGRITHAKCYWNGTEIWVVKRKPQWSDIEWQVRNWNHFTWLSGDHIVEQHVHNIDIINWVLDAHPIKAVSGLGGRQVRTGPEHGYIYDHFAVEFEYPNGVSMFSQCRQINGCDYIRGEEVVGTGGRSNCRDEIIPRNGEKWRKSVKETTPFQLEHEHLIASICDGNPINEAQTIAESTMTAIMGREVVYSGHALTWDDAINANRRLGPEECKFGDYSMPPVAMPGSYRTG